MNKIKKFTTFPNIAVVIVALLIAGFAIVDAQGVSINDRIIQAAGDKLASLLYQDVQSENAAIPEESVFGGAATELSGCVRQGSLVTCMMSGRMNDASTTLLSFRNPFGNASTTSERSGLAALIAEAQNYGGTDATSTVVEMGIALGGVGTTSTGVATTSIDIVCGASTNAFAIPTYNLFYLTLPTSTPGVFINNQATSTAGNQMGLGVIGTGAYTKILLTHDYSYFNCYATGTPSGVEQKSGVWYGGTGAAGKGTFGTSATAKGLIGADNTFDGMWYVKVQRSLAQ